MVVDGNADAFPHFYILFETDLFPSKSRSKYLFLIIWVISNWYWDGGLKEIYLKVIFKLSFLLLVKCNWN